MLIKRSIPFDLGGESDVDYRPEGLVARFKLPARFVSLRTPAIAEKQRQSAKPCRPAIMTWTARRR